MTCGYGCNNSIGMRIYFIEDGQLSTILATLKRYTYLILFFLEKFGFGKSIFLIFKKIRIV